MKESKGLPGFTLVELLITIALMATLSTVAYVGTQRTRVFFSNARVDADFLAIQNALEQYKKDQGHYPNLSDTLKLGEDKNVLCFNSDTSYAHDCAAADILQTQVDNKLMSKRYLQEVPLDPRTDTRYAYAVTSDGKSYQVAALREEKDGTLNARVTGYLDPGLGLASLIRAYNSPDFVTDEGVALPYAPNPREITATLRNITGPEKGVTVGDDAAIEGKVVEPGQIVATGPTSTVTLYFSDGSVTTLDAKGSLRLLPGSEVTENDRDSLVTKIRVKLFSGKIWNKIIRLAAKSEFNVETTESIAGVRGTEFGIDLSGNLTVLSGTVATRKLDPAEKPAAGSGNYVPFDLSFFDVDGNQDASSDGTKFVTFQPPSPKGGILPGVKILDPQIVQNLKDAYYVQGYNTSMKIFIGEIDTNSGSEKFTLYLPKSSPKNIGSLVLPSAMNIYDVDNPKVTLITLQSSKNEFTADPIAGLLTVQNPATVLSPLTGKKIQFELEDAQGRKTARHTYPLGISANMKLNFKNLYLDQDVPLANQPKALGGCVGTPIALKVTSPGNFFRVVAGSSNAKFAAIATYQGSCTEDVTQKCQWSNPQLGTIAQNGGYTALPQADGQDSATCTYSHAGGTLTGAYPFTVMSAAHVECAGTDLIDETQDDRGHWEYLQKACWVLADANQTCTAACPAKLEGLTACTDASTPGGGTDWDDDLVPGNTICMALAKNVVPKFKPDAKPKGEFFSAFAPHISYKPGFATECYSRDAGVNVSKLCDQTPQNNTQQRICRCQ